MSRDYTTLSSPVSSTTKASRRMSGHEKEISKRVTQTHAHDIFQCIDDPVLVNPRRACAARVTVVGSVCLSVCPLPSICLHERAIAL